MYKVIRALGKIGVQKLENGREIAFFSLPQIAIIPRINPPKNIDKKDIPEYEGTEHYRVSQYFYFDEKRYNLANEIGKLSEEIEITESMALQWEREFRWLYYQQFVNDKTKIK